MLCPSPTRLPLTKSILSSSIPPPAGSTITTSSLPLLHHCLPSLICLLLLLWVIHALVWTGERERKRERESDRYGASSGEAVAVALAESDSQSFPSPSLVCRPAPWQPQIQPRWKVSGATGSARVGGRGSWGTGDARWGWMSWDGEDACACLWLIFFFWGCWIWEVHVGFWKMLRHTPAF